jgi:predicted nucleic acid-binding protein
MHSKTYVLDSFALLVLLEDQPGAEQVSDIISDFSTVKYMNVINLGEVLYIVERRRSKEAAIDVLQTIQAEDNIKLVEITLDRAVQAAKIKAFGRLSYADCFATALAKEVNGIVVTGDPEFSEVETEIKIEWLPSNS